MDNYFFTLRDILKENEEKITLNNTTPFFIECITELNDLLEKKAVGVQLNSSEPMIVSYETKTFQWNLNIGNEIDFFIFYSQSGGETGISMTAESVKLSPSLSIAINVISNYYYTTLLSKIQKNLPNKAF